MKIDIKLFFLRFICIGTYKQNRTLFTLTLWVLYKSLTKHQKTSDFLMFSGGTDRGKKLAKYWCSKNIMTSQEKKWLPKT